MITIKAESLNLYYFIWRVLIYILLLLACQSLYAAGFQLREQSTVGQGASFSGVAAGTGDLSSVFFNGASMTLLSGNAVSGSLSLIYSSGDFKNGLASTFDGISIPGDGNYKKLTSMIPSFAAMCSLTEELKIGVLVSTPWGLETEYDRTWIGRYHGIQSKLESINVNPIVAFKLSDRASLSIGLQAQYLDATISNAIDFGTIGMINSIPGSRPGTLSQDGFVKITGDDWGYGWTAGILLKLTEQTRFGLAFRSAISHNLQGNSNFTLDSHGIGSLVSNASGAFIDSDATVNLNTPELYTLGIRHDINSMWSVMAELDLTRWSRLDKLEIQFSNADQNDNVTTLEWSDTWFGSLGFEYKPSDRLRIRSGLAYEEGATSNRFRTSSIPDNDRVWISFGGTYSYNKSTHVHAAFTHLVMRNSKVDLEAVSSLSTGDENLFRGKLSGEFDGDINILATGVTIHF